MQSTGPVLIVGRSGQLATELARAFDTASVPYVALGRGGLDLASHDAINAAVAAVRPALVINAAAYTAVDRAEDEPDMARAINAIGAGRLATAARGAGAAIIHVSTDYVFDGSKLSPYVESDTPHPLGVYGTTKLEGEHLVAAANSRHVILRTAWVYSPHGQNFVKTMLRLARERAEIGVVADQTGTPTSAGDLADAIVAIARRISLAESGAEDFGVFHAAGTGATTWHGFASAIMDGARSRGAKAALVKAITTADFPTRARRPSNSVLDSTKLRHVYAIEMPPWQASLARCLDTLIGPSP